MIEIRSHLYNIFLINSSSLICGTSLLCWYIRNEIYKKIVPQEDRYLSCAIELSIKIFYKLKQEYGRNICIMYTWSIIKRTNINLRGFL